MYSFAFGVVMIMMMLSSMLSIRDFLLLLFLFLIFASIYWYWTIPKNLPPGPLGLPFLGSCLDYLDGSKQHLILLENVKKYGPLFKMYITNKLVVVLGDYEVIQEALVKQGDAFVGRQQMNAAKPERLRHRGIITSEGDLWKEHRRFALTTLRDFGVGRPILENRIKEEAEFLCERISEYAASGQPFGPETLITCAVSNIISQLVYGRRRSYDDEEFFKKFTSVTRKIAASGISLLSPFVISEDIAALVMWLPMVRKMMREADVFVEDIEKEMNQTISAYDPDQDATNYVHAYLKMASTDHGSSFTNDQLLVTSADLFFAGSETTSSTLRFGILYLARHPEVQEKLYQEIKNQVGTSALPNYGDRMKLPYAEAVIMETQRMADIVPLGVIRRTVSPTKVMGYDIPEDTIIVPFLYNILHNPDVYPEPFSFKPERFIDEHGKVIRDPKLIPFQAGKRVCLGEPLARMELFLILIGLCSRFRFYFPSDKPPPTMEPIIGFSCSPVEYKVYVEARND